MNGFLRALPGRRGRVAVTIVLLVLVAGSLVAACSGASSGAAGDTSGGDSKLRAVAAPIGAAASAAPAAPAAGSNYADSGSAPAPDPQAIDYQVMEQTQIVKTGSLAIEVGDLDKALSQAQASIIGLGGYVSQSQRSGTKESATATVTYRIPVSAWDKALESIRALGTKLLSEQTSSTDVTAQVIDLDARIDNLQTTEKALQGIMAKADKIPDVLAVQQQLTTVQGQIEQLTAQRDHLKNQAALSTLAVSFSLPGPAVVTAATTGWDAGSVIDDAVAALVHVGQGLATVGIWLAIVGLPVGLALLVALAILWLVMRRVRPARQAPVTIDSGGQAS